MKERPILFKGEMVRAILDGVKTQTRRVVKDKAFDMTDFPKNLETYFGEVAKKSIYWDGFLKTCPYGKIGDQLWVRETFFKTEDGDIFFKASPESFWPLIDGDFKWKPSIFMPRWASRILLEITNVRIERLNDISEDDARAEGSNGDRYTGQGFDHCIHREAYRFLWESINGPGSWNLNPWVWVIAFKKVTP